MSNDNVTDLDLSDVLDIYRIIFDCTLQQAEDQLRNPDGLRSALARAGAYAHYQSADISIQAAVLAHGIAEGQLFIDGNKRTALATMRTFLLVNGYRVSASQQERAQWILDLSEGLTADQLTERIRATLVAAD